MADLDKVFNIEVADRLSQGCGRHADPACLCDVDVTRTADISWDRGPSALLGVESSAELAQRWADWVYVNEIEGPIKPFYTPREANPNTLFPDRELADIRRKQVTWPQIVELDEEKLDGLVADLLAGTPASVAARERGLYDQTVQSFARALGVARNAGSEPKPWKQYAIDRYAEGIPTPQICQEIAEKWNVPPPNTRKISSWANHAGVVRPGSTKARRVA